MDFSKLQLPNQKEWSAGAGGLLAFMIIAAAAALGHPLNEAIDGGLIALLPGLIAWLVPPSQQDVLKHVNDEIAQAGVIVGKLTAASDQNAPPSTAAQELAAKVQ